MPAFHYSLLRHEPDSLTERHSPAVGQEVNEALLYNWYVFKEVKQNWFAFTILGNGRSGLGPDFARALHSNLPRLFRDFGDEMVTTRTHQ